MTKTIIYKTKNKTYTFEGTFYDGLTLCAEVQKHALANGINLDDIILDSITYK